MITIACLDKTKGALWWTLISAPWLLAIGHFIEQYSDGTSGLVHSISHGLTLFSYVLFFLAALLVVLWLLGLWFGSKQKGPLQQTIFLRTFGRKVPLLASVAPSVVAMDKDRCEIKIPLTRFTKNHLNSMYFGALAIGSDIAGGVMAMDAIARSKEKVDLIFKDTEAKFLKRAEGDVHFTCAEGAAVRKQVDEAIQSGVRCEGTYLITATVPDKFGKEPVAEFKLTLSLKKQ